MDIPLAKFNVSTRPKTLLNFQQIFMINKVLGVGGMGKVFKVTYKPTATPYALKVLKMMDQQTEREVKILALLSKDRRVKNDIVHYVDYFLYQQRPCILMEYIDGDNAAIYFSRHPVTLRQIKQFAVWLCDIVMRLHDINIVHHDIKPDNVIVITTSASAKGVFVDPSAAAKGVFVDPSAAAKGVFVPQQYKLIDFGFSCRYTNRISNDPLACYSNTSGTSVDQPPELHTKPNQH